MSQMLQNWDDLTKNFPGKFFLLAAYANHPSAPNQDKIKLSGFVNKSSDSLAAGVAEKHLGISSYKGHQMIRVQSCFGGGGRQEEVGDLRLQRCRSTYPHPGPQVVSTSDEWGNLSRRTEGKSSELVQIS